jgi:hypothetical protein
MNVLRPIPPCPPFSESWRELIQCYGSVEDFKAFMTEVVSEVAPDVFATKAYVDARYADLMNHISQFATTEYVDQQVQNVTQGVTDGSIAGPGEIGEVVRGQFTYTTPFIIDNNPSGPRIVDEFVMTLPPGSWQISNQVNIGTVSPPGPPNAWVNTIGTGFYALDTVSGVITDLGDAAISIQPTGYPQTGGVVAYWIPTLVYAGDFATPQEIHGFIQRVTGELGGSFGYGFWSIAFRKR